MNEVQTEGVDLKLIKWKLKKNAESYLKEEEAILDGLTPEQRAEVGHPVKSIRHSDTFTANGTKYIIRTSLTLERYEEFENLETFVTYGITFRNLFKNMRAAYDSLNANKVADASVTLHNVMHGIAAKLSDRENEVLLLCSLFRCREDEDVKKYDKDLTREKINDWRKEGIEMDSFFSLAFNLVNGFTPIYEKISQSILDHEANVAEATGAATVEKTTKASGPIMPTPTRAKSK